MEKPSKGPGWFRGGIVFKAHRLLYHSTLGSRVIKKKTDLALPVLDPPGFLLPAVHDHSAPPPCVSATSPPKKYVQLFEIECSRFQNTSIYSKSNVLDSKIRPSIRNRMFSIVNPPGVLLRAVHDHSAPPPCVSVTSCSTVTELNRGSTFALRRSTLHFFLGGKRSLILNGSREAKGTP